MYLNIKTTIYYLQDTLNIKVESKWVEKVYHIKNSKHKKARVVTVILHKISLTQKTTTKEIFIIIKWLNILKDITIINVCNLTKVL